MIYLERIWRGLQLALDLFFLRLFGLQVINPELPWYTAMVFWVIIGMFVAMGMSNWLLLKALFRKPGRRGAGAY